jgi:hypothetical protein
MGFRRAIVPVGSGGLPGSVQPPPTPRPGGRKAHLTPVPSEGLKGLLEVREVEDVRHAIAAAMGD